MTSQCQILNRHPPTPSDSVPQGSECANVKRKRQMLLDEGVILQGEKISRQCVVHAAELAKLVGGGK